MNLELHAFADVDGFLAVAGGFLEAREAEHNLIFGICSYVRDQPNAFGDRPPYFAAVVRRRGYASALVAEASQLQLDAGRRFCFLSTDLANPTSNHIYQTIGYEPVRDVDEYRFGAG